MKPPKLPGVEKFKFWDKSLLEDDDDNDGSTVNLARSNASSGSFHSIFIRGHVIRNTCPGLQQKSVLCDIMDSSNGPHSLPSFRHSDCRRRKVILPISSRLAAKVLTSTDLPLDLFDIRDYHKSTRLRELDVGVRPRRINFSNSSLPSADDHEMASNLSNTSNLSNLSLASTSTSSCPTISDPIIV